MQNSYQLSRVSNAESRGDKNYRSKYSQNQNDDDFLPNIRYRPKRQSSVQPQRKDAGHFEHLVRRRNEERYVLGDELPQPSSAHRFDALLCQHRPRRKKHRHFLRTFGNGQDNPFNRPEASLDWR